MPPEFDGSSNFSYQALRAFSFRDAAYEDINNLYYRGGDSYVRIRDTYLQFRRFQWQQLDPEDAPTENPYVIDGLFEDDEEDLFEDDEDLVSEGPE